MELIKKLASQKIDTSLLRSSKKLGRGDDSRKERLGRALKEQRAGIAGADAESLLFEEREVQEEEEDTEVQPATDALAHLQGGNAIKHHGISKHSSTPTQPTLFGAGLKRPLEVDDDGNPVIKKRQRIKMTPKPRGWNVSTPIAAPQEAEEEEDEDEDEDEDGSEVDEDEDEQDMIERDSEEESWEGFDSGDEEEKEKRRLIGILKKMDSRSDGDMREDDYDGTSSDEEEDFSGEGGVDIPELTGALEEVDDLVDALKGSEDDDEEDDEEEGEDDDKDDDDEEEDDDDDDDEEEDDEEEEDENKARKEAMNERASAFKAWATQQRNDALGFTPSINTDFFAVNTKAKDSAENEINGNTKSTTTSKPAYDPSKDFLLGTLETPKTGQAVRRIHNVTVERTAEIQEARSNLPVVAEEQKIMEAIYNNDCIIVWGATGSGKTTQVPQFLFEAGYGDPNGPTPGIIGVTQPRRVAAVSMAKRVAVELGEHHDKVAHQIRFDSTVSSRTAVKFMTDGVLLREVSQDFMLSKYSAIVLDEAHERTVNTDLLIGMLCRVVEMRAEQAKKSSTKYKPLKLIIMSATLRTADLTKNKNLFRTSPPPIVQAEGRQYPVTTHFTRRTERDYVEESFSKVSRGHRKLPPGGMLVFLTGQNEINALMKRLKSSFDATDSTVRTYLNVRISAAEASVEDEDIELGRRDSQHVDDEDDSDDEIHGADNDAEFDIGEDPHEQLKVHVLPLYSQLPTEQQMRVFQAPPDGSRLIVLATNVAETSLTIPGVRYVFDCGRAKEKQYDLDTGVQSFEVGWISKASASQRAGRAGRTGPGHCYRLYSSAVYERDFPEFGEPEITRTPIEGVVLQLKSMGIPKVAAFPFPTPPDHASLVKAERLLEYLGALSAEGKVTAMGKELSLYPLSPRLSRMLCIAQAHGVIDYTITLVAALAVRDLLIPDTQLQLDDPRDVTQDAAWSAADHQAARENEERRKSLNHFHGQISRLDRSSDALKLLTLLTDFGRSQNTSQGDNKDDYYRFSRVKAVNEALQLRGQLATIVNTHRPGSATINSTRQLSDPSKAQINLLRQIIAAGYIDQLAIRADQSPTPPANSNRKPKKAADVPYLTLLPSHIGNSKKNSASELDEEDDRAKYVYIHPSSVLAHSTSAEKMPKYLIYSHLSRSSSTLNATKVGRTRLHPLTPVSEAQILALAMGTPLVEEGKPVGKVEVLERDGKGRERRAVWTVPFLKGEGGGLGLGWPLPPARRVVQVRMAGRGWVVEI